ncbi:unnamed protein product [Clonostachys rosea f. rosea IK726]|uniref:Uncharacterized protein n=1 Tax=Clonostachys rosea f. rosea IK726 TaxID=1349383 RepID=A0ACA9THG1_BIOOC|nr:unnamed protein product [Clonostachys rosea f. rosea IK726]
MEFTIVSSTASLVGSSMSKLNISSGIYSTIVHTSQALAPGHSSGQTAMAQDLDTPVLGSEP